MSVSNNSGAYAEIDSASNVDLLSNKSGRSASFDLEGRKSSRTATIAVVSLALSCLCLATILGLFACWVFVFNDGELWPGAATLRGSGKSSAEVCLPCVQIGPNPLDDSPSSAALLEELDVRYEDQGENATEICCASTSAQYAALFKLILKRQQAVKRLADTLDEETKKNDGNDVNEDDASREVTRVGRSAVSAHLVFKPRKQARSADADEEPREQEWKSPTESPMSHVREGLQLRDKRIIVQTPGLYYVYCQILYSPSGSSSDAMPSHDVASAYVRRYSILRPAAPDFLLKSRHTRHDVSQDRHSSYVGGVFRLHSGDSLYVQVSRPDLVSHDDMGSFFGLFKIGG